MNKLTSISTRILLVAFACVGMAQTAAHSGSLDERFKAAIHKTILKVQETPDPVEKRKMLGKFLNHMDQGIGMVKGLASEKDEQTLDALQLKLRSDYASLNGTGTAKISDAELNHFALYVQQDVEQADEVIYISAGGLIIILIILLILL